MKNNCIRILVPLISSEKSNSADADAESLFSHVDADRSCNSVEDHAYCALPTTTEVPAVESHRFPHHDKPKWTPELLVTCSGCGRRFNPDRRNYQRGRGKFCSPACARANQFGKLLADYTEDTQARKIRANGLINKRVKQGLIVRPKRCQLCRAKCRTDAHHPDYSRPFLVAWVCRSCHNTIPHRASFAQRAAEIAEKNLHAARAHSVARSNSWQLVGAEGGAA